MVAGQQRQTKEVCSVEARSHHDGAGSGANVPLDYMLSVMNDPGVDDARRDRMAVLQLPYVHIRAADAKPGKKEAAEQAARTAARGTSWDKLLQ